MELVLSIIISLLIGVSGSALGMGFYKDAYFANLPPKVIREEIHTEQRTEVMVRSEMNSYQVQTMAEYNDAELALLLSLTNQTFYSNFLTNIETNANWSRSTTNRTTNDPGQLK